MPYHLSRRDAIKLGTLGAAGIVAACGNPARLDPRAEAISNPGNGKPSRGGVLRYGLSTDVSNFEPQVSTGAAATTVQQLAYNTLLQYGPTGAIVGDLASDFGFVNPTTYELTLRDGVTFHNGQPLTVDDVIFSLRRIMDKRTAATSAKFFTGVTSISAAGRNKVVLKLREPNVVLPHALAATSTTILSKEWITGGADTKTTMMGTGPFKLVERVPGVSTTLARNPHYYDSDLPHLNAVQFLPMPDDYSRVEALLSATVDFIDYVPATHIDVVRKAKGVTFAGDNTFGFGFVGFVTNRKPVSDLRVRQAFAYGLDRQSIVETAFLGNGKPITGGLLPPGILGHDPALASRYPYDPDRSKHLLRQAGLSTLDINLLTTSTYSVIYRPAEAALAGLQRSGINPALTRQEWLPFRETVKAHTFPAHVWGTSITYGDPDALRDFFGSGGTWAKYWNFADDRVDALLGLGRRTADPGKRAEIYHEVESRVLDLLPCTYTVRRVQGEAMRDYVKGYAHPKNGTWTQVSLRGAWLDKP